MSSICSTHLVQEDQHRLDLNHHHHHYHHHQHNQHIFTKMIIISFPTQCPWLKKLLASVSGIQFSLASTASFRSGTRAERFSSFGSKSQSSSVTTCIWNDQGTSYCAWVHARRANEERVGTSYWGIIENNIGVLTTLTDEMVFIVFIYSCQIFLIKSSRRQAAWQNQRTLTMGFIATTISKSATNAGTRCKGSKKH